MSIQFPQKNHWILSPKIDELNYQNEKFIKLHSFNERKEVTHSLIIAFSSLSFSAAATTVGFRQQVPISDLKLPISFSTKLHFSDIYTEVVRMCLA
ncbi:unnamed protein product [Cochlearia groenlandica]